jgi:peroxiredoxin
MMRYTSLCLGCLLALPVLAGCGDGKTDETKTKTKSPGVKTKTPDEEQEKKTIEAAVLPPRPPPEIKKVLLSAAEEATCLVKQGGQFPDAKLKDLSGADRAISQLRGQQATVVLLWTNQNRANKAALQQLSVNAQNPPPGVNYLGICVGDDAATAQSATKQMRTPFPVLLDSNRELFKQVVKVPEGGNVTDVLPRVFLLGPSGNVLWMSVAYQSADDCELKSALEFMRGETAKKGE